MKKYTIIFSFLIVLLLVSTTISAQHTSSIEQGQSNLSSSADFRSDSTFFSSSSFDGKDSKFLPDSLFQYNSDGTGVLLFEVGQIEEDKLLKAGVKKDVEGNYITPDGKTIKSLVVRKGKVRSDSIISRKE